MLAFLKEMENMLNRIEREIADRKKEESTKPAQKSPGLAGQDSFQGKTLGELDGKESLAKNRRRTGGDEQSIPGGFS